MPNRYPEEKFNNQKKLLILSNFAIFLFVVFGYPQDFGFWGFRGANIYAASILFPAVIKIITWDYWFSNRLDIETKIVYWWIVTVGYALLALVLQPFIFMIAEAVSK